MSDRFWVDLSLIIFYTDVHVLSRTVKKVILITFCFLNLPYTSGFIAFRGGQAPFHRRNIEVQASLRLEY